MYIRYIQYSRKGRIEIQIIISNTSDKPIYEQITQQIKNQIMNGGLQPGDALPSMRTLAKDLRISVITTKRAYEDLEREGFISTVVGKGSFVAAANTELLKEEKLRIVEEFLQKAVMGAKEGGIPLEELREILELLYQED